ncbi:hypothetical protein [Pontibacter akesuensis]|uniref:Uncharacterized protein n=1 Tax=Pontibacter akesuensis TaxID=388950 RepID=A0A1I7K417_9BACT|nr:hypothetical protein [Pontibacter akesuensis]GHA75263.1 hypothetical protein GCM10007389_31400 [Pontibacter akesuensis]SFU92122.1 hypothetical protein SAMN04487941_3364 [Pontibacter akesuensis]
MEKPKHTRAYRYLVLAVFSLFAMSWQCGEYAEPDYTHIIREKVDLYPYKKAYAVGDTIWIDTNITDRFLYDEKISQRVEIDSVALPLKLSFNKLYKRYQGETGPFFEAIYADPVQKHPEYLFFTYACNQPDYDFRVGIVLLKPGIYSLVLHDQNYFSNCITEGAYSRIYYTFNVADSNKDVFLSIPAISRGGLNTDRMDSKEEFIVQVVE